MRSEIAAPANDAAPGIADRANGLRAIGVELNGEPPIAQVSTNVEQPLQLPLSAVVQAVREQAEIARVELVGLVPRAALAGFPADLPWRGGDPTARTIENALGF